MNFLEKDEFMKIFFFDQSNKIIKKMNLKTN